MKGGDLVWFDAKFSELNYTKCKTNSVENWDLGIESVNRWHSQFTSLENYFKFYPALSQGEH